MVIGTCDPFDALPDSLFLLILNKLADARSLGRCRAVSRRFNALVPHVQTLLLKIDRVDESPLPSSPKPPGLLCHVLKYVIRSVIRPILHLKPLPRPGHRSPAQVLKTFPHVRDLRIELPAGDIATDDGVVLRWRAEFGSTLHSCVILGGTRVDCHVDAEVDSPEDGIPEAFYTDGGLKLRVVWTISSLIAASTRHFLVRQIVKDHATLKSLVLTDADGQGTLTMGEDQLKEFRERPVAAAAAAARTMVPASLLKLRYASRLVLPGGVCVVGATLVGIRPSPEAAAAARKDGGEGLVDGFSEEPFAAAAKALFHRRVYLLEMNSF